MKTLTKRGAKSAARVQHPQDMLSRLENRINTADKDAWLSRISTGHDLAEIKDKELYRDVINPLTGEAFSTFKEYIETPTIDSEGMKSYRFFFDLQEANLRIKHAISYQLLEQYREEKHLEYPLPENAFQMRFIARLPQAKRAPLYFDAIKHAQRCSVNPSAEFLSTFLKNGIVEEKPATEEAEDVDPSDVVFPDEPVQKRYNQYAQEALNRVEKLSAQHVFPEGAAKAIREGFIDMDDEDLAMWSRFPDEDFIPVGRLILREKISFTAARRFHGRCKGDEFLDNIVLYAIKEGSSVLVNHKGFQIQIRPVPAK